MAQQRKIETERESLTAKYRDWDGCVDTQTDDTPFKDLIQRDPCVCDHCFTLRYEELSHEWSQGELGWMEFRMWVPIAGRSTEIPSDDGHGTRLACQACGHRTTKHRPLPKHKVNEMADNLSQTLTEKGIDHDNDVLRHTIERRNVSANQGRQDSDVFAPAVKAAIEAEYGPGRPNAEQYK